MKTRTYSEEAHLIVLGLFDKLEDTERRIAFCERQQAIANLSAIQININEAIRLLAEADRCGFRRPETVKPL